MRLPIFSALTLVVVPTVAFALTIQPASFYHDVRANAPEAAGIHMLTREGVVQGYGNGFFGSSRQINRAEFLKTVISALAKHPSTAMRPEFDEPEIGEAGDPFCFGDVRIGDWFSPFVCYAFSKGIVSGNPNGLFHPERTVSYGEALKMLTLGFGYDIPQVRSADWAEPYYRSAKQKQVDLPVTIALDTPLTRGLAVRLIAAFVAESQGALQELRYAESGRYAQSASSASSISGSASSVVSSSSSSFSSSASSSKMSPFTLPVTSHFLVAGQTSDAIASVLLHSTGSVASIVSAQVKLFSETTSVDTLELVRADDGTLVTTLLRRTTTDTTDYKLTYEAQIPVGQQQIPADTDVRLVLRAKIRSPEGGGASDQLLQVRTFSVTFHAVSSDLTTNVPAMSPFPKHQTSFGRVTAVKRLSPVSAQITSGTGIALGVFSFAGTSIPGRSLAIDELVFTVSKTGGVSVTQWRIGILGSPASVACSLGQDGTMLTCPNLSSFAELSSSAPLSLDVRANLFVPKGSTDSSLQLDLWSAGTPEELGSVRWTDQSGHFRWIESDTPVARGTRWQ